MFNLYLNSEHYDSADENTSTDFYFEESFVNSCLADFEREWQESQKELEIVENELNTRNQPGGLRQRAEVLNNDHVLPDSENFESDSKESHDNSTFSTGCLIGSSNSLTNWCPCLEEGQLQQQKWTLEGKAKTYSRTNIFSKDKVNQDSSKKLTSEMPGQFCSIHSNYPVRPEIHDNCLLDFHSCNYLSSDLNCQKGCFIQSCLVSEELEVYQKIACTESYQKECERMCNEDFERLWLEMSKN